MFNFVKCCQDKDQELCLCVIYKLERVYSQTPGINLSRSRPTNLCMIRWHPRLFPFPTLGLVRITDVVTVGPPSHWT